MVAALLRISLAWVNRAANDNHMEVIRVILNESRIPNLISDCHQCYRPKLYYLFSAGLLKLFTISSEEGRIIFAQYINVFRDDYSFF